MQTVRNEADGAFEQSICALANDVTRATIKASTSFEAMAYFLSLLWVFNREKTQKHDKFGKDKKTNYCILGFLMLEFVYSSKERQTNPRTVPINFYNLKNASISLNIEQPINLIWAKNSRLFRETR